MIVSDEGWHGTVIHISTHGIDIDRDGNTVLLTAAAGENWDDLVSLTLENGWSGLEALSGIPGTVGGTPIQNVGAYGSDVSRTIAAVEVFDRVTRATEQWPAARCQFSQRRSIFKRNSRFVVISATFRLAPGDVSAPIYFPALEKALGIPRGDCVPIAHVRKAVLDLRNDRGMVLDSKDHDTWSTGSFFLNPILQSADGLPGDKYLMPDGQVKVSAASLIRGAGFDLGYRLPGSGVSLSRKYWSAITNRGSGTAQEVIALARQLKFGVSSTYGVILQPEPEFFGPNLDL